MKRTFFGLIVLLLSFCLLLASCKEKHVHDWSDWTVTKEATCTEPGERMRECSCGASGTEATALAPHSYNEYEVCEICGHEKDEPEDPSVSDGEIDWPF